jgi:hypothetical protein
MPNSDSHRRRQQRHLDSAAKDQGKVVGIAKKLAYKQDQLAKARTPVAQKRLSKEILALLDDRANAEKSAVRHQKIAMTEQQRAVADEKAEQKRAELERQREARALQRSLRSTSDSMATLDQRISTVEQSLISRVRQEIAADPTGRDHDVFLSYADPDEADAQELHIRLVERGLSVWVAPFSRRLGESLTRQLDKGIASSKVGVPFITKEYLAGRYWTEKEYGAFFSTKKRIIPVLHGVSHAELGKYSPMLADLMGLSTKDVDLDQIADAIAEALGESEENVA